MDGIEIIRGDTATISVTITNKNGDTIEFEDIDTLILTCRKMPSKSNEVLFKKTKEDFRFEDNKYKVDLKAEDTEQLKLDKPAYFDIEVTLKNGTRKSRIYEMSIIKDYTIHGGDSNE